MKRIYIIIFISLLYSCSSDKVEISKQEYERLKKPEPKPKPKYPKPFHFKSSTLNGINWEIIIGEDNHEYLQNDAGKRFVLIHYPDCKKCLNKLIIK